MEILLYCTLDEMKEFLVESTCRSYIPYQYARDENVLLERRGENGSIYIEAEEKKDLDTVREITFVEANNVIGIIYNSKSGNTQLKWRQVYGKLGKLTGEASTNTLVNLFTVGIKTIQPVESS
jgi:hypothetical protein